MNNTLRKMSVVSIIFGTYYHFKYSVYSVYYIPIHYVLFLDTAQSSWNGIFSNEYK